MEGFFTFVLFVLAVWFARRLRRAERENAAAQQASEKALSGLTKRIYDLGKELASLRQPAAQPGAVELTPKVPAPPAPAGRPPSPPPPQIAPVPAQTETPAAVTPIPLAPKLEPSPPFAPAQQHRPPVSPPPPRTTPAPPASSRTQPIAPALARRWSDIEEILGTNWLNKIGITILVIGLGLLLNFWIPRLSVGSKIALAYTLCAVLLALGVYGERRERYRRLARVVLGGGWAATYATTYALSNVEAVRLVKDPMTGFLLLFLVAAGILTHSLRYNSQVVTGFAYLLGFVTLVLGRIEMGTMAASALLAASLVVVLWKKKWYAIEPLALAAVYGVHWLWLRQIFEDLGGKKPFPEFYASGALLTVYWALFTISYFLRGEQEPGQRRAFAGTLLLNAAGFLSVMGYQSLDPRLRFRFLLAVGAAYLALAVFSRRVQRRLGFLLTSTLGSALVMVALYYKFTGANLELLWVAEAQVLLFVGWRAADAHFRRLGWCAAGVVVPYVVFHHLWPRFVENRALDAPLGWLLLAMAAIYFADARFVPRFLRNDATPMDTLASRAAGPVGTALLLAAAWVAIPFLWVAVAWAVVALLLREYSHWRKDSVLQACAYAAAGVAIVRLVVANLAFHPAPGAANLRYWTMALAVAVLYAFASRLRTAEEPVEAANLIAEFLGSGYSALVVWTATLPVALLIATESPRPPMLTWIVLGLAVVASIVSYPVALGYLMTAVWLALPFMWVALVWTSLAVLVGELGLRRDHRALRACGHLAAVFALLRLLVVNLQHAPLVANLSLRLVTVALSVALFYIFARRVAGRKTEELEWRGRIAPLYSISATLLATLLIWREAGNAAVALAWAMFGLALAEVARVRHDRPLRMQGYALLTLSFARIFFADLNAANELFRLGAGFMITPRLLSVSALAVIYYCAARTAEDDWPRMRTALDWFGTVALAALARFELPLAWVAVGWAAMTAALYFAGGRPGLQAFRRQASLLALLVGVRCAFDNFYQTAPVSGSSGVSIRTVTVVAACALLYILLGPALWQTRERKAGAAPQRGDPAAGFWRRWAEHLDRNAQHLYFFLPTLLLTVLISLEFHQRADLRSYLTAAWGLEGMLVFLVALLLGERAFRWFGLGLLLLCVGRLVTVDVWGLSGLGKIVSFMGLGAALLVVSFLYARYRETWQKYL